MADIDARKLISNQIDIILNWVVLFKPKNLNFVLRIVTELSISSRKLLIAILNLLSGLLENPKAYMNQGA